MLSNFIILGFGFSLLFLAYLIHLTCSTAEFYGLMFCLYNGYHIFFLILRVICLLCKQENSWHHLVLFAFMNSLILQHKYSNKYSILDTLLVHVHKSELLKCFGFTFRVSPYGTHCLLIWNYIWLIWIIYISSISLDDM